MSVTCQLRTLPQLAREWDVAIDVLRDLVRRKPELSALAVRIGGARAFAPDGVAAIKAAFDSRPYVTKTVA